MIAVISEKMGLEPRDVACFMFALGIHSLLLFWKGGLFVLPETKNDALGDMITSVNFMAEVPDYSEPAGGSAPAATSFLQRMKSIIKGEGAEAKKAELASGPKPDEIAQQPWNKTQDQIANKPFQRKFEGFDTKKDALDIAVGKQTTVDVKPSQGDFKTATPNLKQDVFKVAKKDAPFPILKQNSPDALANVNAIPIAVGRTTSNNVKSLDGGPTAAPAMQSKSFSKSPSGGGGFSGSASGSGASNSGGISTGGGATQIAAGGGFGSAPAAGTGGSGYGSGTGSGKGSSGSGTGFGNGSGRSWGGGGYGGSSEIRAIPRNTISDRPAGTNTSVSKDTDYNIVGELRGRPVVQKVRAAYERDCRVALRFRVDWSGRVLDGILVEISSGSPSFDQKVINALRQWLFAKLPADRSSEVQEGVITFLFKGV